ncbi:hypothetical protein BBJ28_00010411 [Nothophytophthora sp. Chile5]|nr:hypothetical protein BBJ28_00010411 [Nothophytophthora sp. Chile5]
MRWRLTQVIACIRRSAQPVSEPMRKEQAVARFNFVPQDSSTQLRLTKGDEVDVVRKDSDGWWFVIKDGEKGLVPGAYLHIENPIIPVTDAAILAAREASNQRFMELSRSSGESGSARGSETGGVEYQSPMGLEGLALSDSCAPRPPTGPIRADAKSGGSEFKPGEVRKLKKCYACKETILGRTKVCKDQIFHEIVLLTFAAVKIEVINRLFFTLAEKKEREEREAVLERERAAAKAKAEKEAALAAARALEEKKAREAREAAEAKKAAEEEARAKAEAEAAAVARAQAEAEAAEADALQKAAAAAVSANTNGRGKSDSRRSSTSSLDQFDLEATPMDTSAQNGGGRISEISDLDSVLSDGEYAGYMGAGGSRDSLRLSEVLDLESVDPYSSSGDRLSDLSGISEGAGGRPRPRRSTIETTVKEHDEEFSEDEEDRELCGGCGLVLEGEAVGALNQYFHYEVRTVRLHDEMRMIAANDLLGCASNVVSVSKAIAGYRFDAQDDTQLTIYPGDEVAILQKVRPPDDDGWWLVELRNKRGYVPGSYLIERPVEEPKPQPSKKKSSPKPKPQAKAKPKRKAGLCSECSTQNPAEARFCRSCGNNLMA